MRETRFEQKLWDTTEKKKARKQTIPLALQILDVDRVTRQYWTLCGKSTNNGQPVGPEDSEYTYGLSSGLYKPSNFYGVDRNFKIIHDNRLAYPEAHWIRDDFYEAIRKADAEGWFDPEVINFDCMNMTRRAAEYLFRIMSIVSYSPNPVAIVVNMIVQYEALYVDHLDDFMHVFFVECDASSLLDIAPWQILRSDKGVDVYEYRNVNSYMNTIWFFKK